MPESKKIGFIGGGMMAEAIIKGVTSRGVVKPENIYVSDHKAARAKYLADTYHVNAVVGSESFIGAVDVVVLAVKPQVVEKAVAEIAGNMKPYAMVVSIVAGVTIAALKEKLAPHDVVRVMPNTPLAVGAGMSAYAVSDGAYADGVSFVAGLFAAGGEAVEVKESMMDAVTGLSGSGPAYGFLVIDALSDGGVMAGLPRATARLLAAQTMLGAAEMVLKTGEHPDVLRDGVTSPAGTTIAGVRVMEEKGVRGALMDAVMAAADRSRELGSK